MFAIWNNENDIQPSVSHFYISSMGLSDKTSKTIYRPHPAYAVFRYSLQFLVAEEKSKYYPLKDMTMNFP